MVSLIGVKKTLMKKIRNIDSMNVKIDHNEQPENPYLIMNFWNFAILSTLMCTFFPWSLLFCVFVYGLEETKYICLALIHDALKTFLAVISILLPILALIIFIIFMVAQ